MSSAEAHDDHEAHAFDGEPTNVLPADEPRTPGWLTVLGLVFFVGVAVALLAGQDPAAPDAAAAPAPQGQAQVVHPAAAPTAPAPQMVAPPGTVRRLTPDQIQQLGQVKQRVEKINGMGAPPGAPKAAPHAPGAAH
jgi:hypothetical protein